jgi:muconate cycloisomerase
VIISDVQYWQVRVPMKPDTVNSPEWGPAGFDEVPKFIIRLRTDEGLEGLGETARGEREEDVACWAEHVRGLDPLALNWQDLPAPGGGFGLVGQESQKYPPRPHEPRFSWDRVYDAVEMAIYDLVGKALGLPVYKLLGGGWRDRVPVDYWCGRMSPADCARKAREAAAQGFRGLKMKCALEDPMVERAQAIAEAAGPDFRITIDPNERFYRPAEAIRLAREMEGYNVEVFEDPFPKWNVDWYVLFRQKTTVPVAMHLGDPRDVIMAIKREAVDYFNLAGPMASFVKVAAIADAAGIPCWHGSGVDLGIRDASYVHACAAARGCTLASDIIGNFLREDDLIVESLRIERGYAVVPQGPGLGVHLDAAALEHYRVR